MIPIHTCTHTHTHTHTDAHSYLLDEADWKKEHGFQFTVDAVSFSVSLVFSALRSSSLEPGDINFSVCTSGSADKVGNLNLFPDATHIVSSGVCRQGSHFLHGFQEVLYRAACLWIRCTQCKECWWSPRARNSHELCWSTMSLTGPQNWVIKERGRPGSVGPVTPSTWVLLLYM